MTAREIALEAVRLALEKQALEPVLIDLTRAGGYTDYILLVSGRSARQVDALAEHLAEGLRGRGRRIIGVEGVGGGHWALIDVGDLVVHVFYHPTRERYDLEGLWADAPRVPLDVPPQARAQVADMY